MQRTAVSIVAMLLLMICTTSRAADAPKPPNIIMILADDLGYKDLGVYGSTFYETPNLDRLASEGMRFTQAYAACPVCSPTRASLMTGQYPARVGLTDFLKGHTVGKLLPPEYLDELPLETFKLPVALHEAGYATWHVGKWHLGRPEFYPEHQGFDVNVGGSRSGSPKGTYFSPWGLENLKEGPKGKFLTDELTDHAVELIRNSKGKPFYMNYCSYAPHVPIQAPKDLVEKYEAKAKRMGLDQSKAIVEGEYFPIENKKNKRVERRQFQSDPVYAGLIENLDMNIGRLLKALDESGQAENTIVVFTSDNGGLQTAEGAPTEQHPLRDGKGWMYEGGIREPLIVRWPGMVKAGSTSDAVVTTPDYLPTFLEAAGVKIPEAVKIDGISLVTALKQSGPLQRDAIFWHYPHYGNQGGTPGAAVRAGDWKLIEWFEGDHYELYNLKDDIAEEHDLAKDQPDRVKAMKKLLKDWQTDVGARFPTANPDYKPR